MKSTHSQRLERWLGTERIEHISGLMKNWHGGPITLLDVPGSVRVSSDGDFSGPFDRGFFMSAMDSLEAKMKAAWRGSGQVQYGVLNAGFSSISDALSQASQGFVQYPAGAFNKIGPTGVVGVTSSLHKLGPQPAAGAAASAAPGGIAYVDSDTGGMIFANPSAGSLRLVGADISASVINNTLLLYDRIFGVAKTMNSVANEAVTGTPSRYQSSTATAENYAGGNFLFVEVGLTALAATAHNWGVAGSSNECLYRNQAGTDNQIMPVMVGNSGAIVHRLDHPVQQWFAPLAAGDTGVMDLAQMRCSATVATGLIDFVIGHPIGFMSFPVINSLMPFDWLTNRDQAPRIFDDAYLAFLEINKPATATTTYTGRICATSTAS